MNDDELRDVLAELEHYEGREHQMYLDGDKPPNVTIGVGCLLSSVTKAQALPFHHVSNGQRATAAEIATDFFRVQSMRGGLPAHAYHGPLALSDEAVDELAFSRLRATIAGLRELCPGFDGFPAPAKCGLLDLGWNLGTGPYPGLEGWPNLLKACNAIPPDWATAAKESHCSTSREARNAYRADCFLAAATLGVDGTAKIEDHRT